MPTLDLALLHAPSVYDFRERPAMGGPISDVVPSTPVFEMYPLGFVSMVGFLEQHGYHARIVNLAVRMLRNPKFDVGEYLRKLEARVYGFDLHWLAHAGGSLDLAQVVKEHHPDAPVVLGGLSATYFHEEIMAHFPQVDFVLRGDTTEKPLLDLLDSLEGGGDFSHVENLTWRTPEGRVKANPLSYVPTNLDDLFVDYGSVVKQVLRYRDLESVLPYESFMNYPFTAVITCKGCAYNCITCGGSCYAFQNFFNREGPTHKSPGKLVEEVAAISEYFKAPIFLVGDLRQGGLKWAEGVLEALREEQIDNTLTFELFDAAPRGWLERLADSTPSWTIEISPESHDDQVRHTMGKPYTTKQMEETIEKAYALGAQKVDVFFMVGLSGQTRESALASVEYARHLYGKVADPERLFCFTSPMAPFLDPGSMVYENPEKYGFTRLYHTLREHKEALMKPSWKHYLNYHTKWMSRDTLAETTYDAMLGMNEVKMEYGVVPGDHGEAVREGLLLAKEVMGKIDEILRTSRGQEEVDARLHHLREELETVRRSRSVFKNELRMPGMKGIRLRGAVRFLIKYLVG